MPISIVTRAYRSSELKNLISNLSQNNELEFEVIAVCNIKDLDYEGITVIVENSSRFKAKITGIWHARFERVLLLDSDQILEKGLLTELNGRTDDMVIIPEKSLGEKFVSRCLDDWRFRNERRATENPRPEIPVIPRFYWKKQLTRAAEEIKQNLFEIVNHEDSVLYHYVYLETKSIGFSSKHILNDDPSLFKILEKAFQYGKSDKLTADLDLPDDLSNFLNKLNLNSLNIGELGIGRGVFLQLLRGFIYEIGKTFG